MKDELPNLLQLWRKAFALKNAGDPQSAIPLLEQLLQLQPDWEHGHGFFDLAQCYEGIQKIADAKSAYERAIQNSPTDPILLGGFASFLYLHGEPRQAFDEHVRLLALERKRGDANGMSATTTALKSLGSRLGWSDKETEDQIAKALVAFS